MITTGNDPKFYRFFHSGFIAYKSPVFASKYTSFNSITYIIAEYCNAISFEAFFSMRKESQAKATDLHPSFPIKSNVWFYFVQCLGNDIHCDNMHVPPIRSNQETKSI